MVAGAKSAAGATAKILDTIMRPDKKIREFGRGFFQGMREELRGSKIKENVDGIGKAISGLAQKLIIFQLLKQAFSSLIKGAKEAFSAYLVADKSLGASVRDLQASLKTLQGSLASAFAPIVEAVVPYLSTMVNWLITAANAVAQFTAALMGKSVYKKASANIAATGAAAGSAANQVEKLNKKLGAYDELKTIDQDNGSGGSGGGGGGGASGGGIDYEDVDIDSGISDFADKVKEAWEKADFTEIGTIVGTKLKDALDNINWEGIKETTQRMAQSIATFLNGFIGTEGLFTSIGTTIAEAINTALTFASTFLNTFDFKQLGTALMEALGGFFETFSWSTLASTIQGWGDAWLDFMTGIIRGIDWKNLPQNIIKAIKDFFSGINWAEHFESIGALIGAAVAAGIDLLGAIAKVIGDIATKIKDYFVEKINAAGYSSDASLLECGKAIIVGIFNGIIDWFKNIAAWINDNIISPFLKGFGFEEGKDKQSLLDLGDNLICGIFKGVTDWFKGIKQWVTDNVQKPFTDAWGDVFGKDGLVDTAISIAVGVVEDAKHWVADAWTALSSAGKTAYSTIKAKVEDAVGSAREAISNAWEAIKDKGATLSAKVANAAGTMIAAVSSAWEYIKDKGATLSAKVANAAGTVISTVSAAWEVIKDKGATLSAKVANAAGSVISAVSAAWSDIKDKGATLSAKVANAAGSVISSVTTAWANIKDKGATLSAKVANAAGTVITTVTGAWDKIKDKGATLSAKVANAAGTVISTVTSAWDKIKDKGATLNAKVANAAGTVINAVTDAWSAIKNKTATLTAKAKNKNSSTLASIKSAWSAIYTKAATLTVGFINKAYDTMVSILSAIKAIFTAPDEKTIKVNYNYVKSGSATEGGVHARGGVYHGGRSYPFSQAAGGGSFSHGTMILAGEHGAEVAGHINGRTEILNQSQLAAVMYSSVVNGMAAAIGAVMGHMTECTNAIIANISFLVDSMDYVASVMPAYAGITTGFVPDINRTSGVLSGGMSLDALAAAVADRISGNIQIENVMNMDGRAVYRGMVEIDRQTIRQTGRSGFGG